MQPSARGSVVQVIQCFFGAGKIGVFLPCFYIVYDMIRERDRCGCGIVVQIDGTDRERLVDRCGGGV